MAIKGDIKAGGAFVRLFLKDDLTGSLKAVLATAAAGATAVAGAITAATTSFVQFGSQINDVAARTGASTTSLQHWKFAAEQTGASIEDVEIALKRMARNGMNTANFEAIGKNIASIADPSQRAAAALDAFGKSGTKLLPMFAELNSLKAASAALGPVLTPEEIALADQLGDAFDALGEALQRAIHQIGASFGPALKSMLDGAIGAVTTFSRLMKETNKAGAGGDWLDKAAEFLRTPFSDFQKAGAAGSQAMTMKRILSKPGGEEGGSAAAGKVGDMTASIIRGFEDRNRLIREFETPAEKFLRRQNEINNALIAVNRNRVMGAINEAESAAQRKGLETAMFRLRQEEMRRLRPDIKAVAEMKEPTKEPEMPVFQTSSAFSAFGAMALGAGGGQSKVVGELSRSHKIYLQQLRKLEEIERKLSRRPIAT